MIFTKFRDTKDQVMNNKKFNIGDRVTIDGYTSMAQSALAHGDQETIKDIRKRFDEVTGDEYQQVKAGGRWYDARTGESVRNSMYYIIV